MKKFKCLASFLLLSLIGCVRLVLPTEKSELLGNISANSLSVVRSGYDTVKIQLDNIDHIYALQFTIWSSSNVILKKFIPSFLTIGKYWDVDFYKVNDSLMNVLIFNLNKQYIPAGSGAIGELSFMIRSNNPVFSISLSKVMVTNKDADSLGVIIHNLEGKIQ